MCVHVRAGLQMISNAEPGFIRHYYLQVATPLCAAKRVVASVPVYNLCTLPAGRDPPLGPPLGVLTSPCHAQRQPQGSSPAESGHSSRSQGHVGGGTDLGQRG